MHPNTNFGKPKEPTKEPHQNSSAFPLDSDSFNAVPGRPLTSTPVPTPLVPRGVVMGVATNRFKFYALTCFFLLFQVFLGNNLPFSPEPRTPGVLLHTNRPRNVYPQMCPWRRTQ